MNSQLSRRTTETHKLYNLKEIEDLPPAEVNDNTSNPLQLTERYSSYGRKGCIAAGCKGDHCARGFCRKHYYRQHRHGDLERHYPKPNPNPPTICNIPGCTNKRCWPFRACGHHRYLINRYGDPLAVGVFDDTLGGQGQDKVAIALQSFGRTVEVAPYNSPYDLLIDGKYRIEVKSGAERFLRKGKYSYRGWQFNIHRHGVLNEASVDFYVLSFAHRFLLLKAPVNKKTIAFQSRPLAKGKYRKYIEAFLSFAKGEIGKVEVAA